MTTNSPLWERFCHYYRYYPSIGLSLDISRMRFADGFFSEMLERTSHAFREMQALETGALANPDEKRMVGHYWLRNPALAPMPDIQKSIVSAVESIKKFARRLHQAEIKGARGNKFSRALVVGIGGSALGPQLVADCFTRREQPMQILFCDNTDPDGIRRTLDFIGNGLSETLVIAISKSGSTPESRNGVEELRAAFLKQDLEFAKNIVAITCPGSKLDQQAKNERWLDSFPMWDWVGGRTSLFSAVGLLPAALQGVNIDQFLAGASEMDAITREPDAENNPAMLLALMWYAAGGGKGKKDMVVLPYKDRLVLFSKYLQQLVMESIGKEKNLRGETVHQGIAVYGNKGSTDQHAYIQQLRDGLNNFFVTFIEVLVDHTQYSSPMSSGALEIDPGITSGDYLSGFLQGTQRALYENNRDVLTLTVEELTEKTLGALIALYERAVGYYATLVDINAYHQPGVEAGKKAASRVLELQKKVVTSLQKESNTPRSALELAQACGEPEEVESIYKILEHLAHNPGRGVQRSGQRGPTTSRFTYLSKNL